MREDNRLGMIGLGVMGRNLLLNMAEKGFPVGGYDLDSQKVKHLKVEGTGFSVQAADSLEQLLAKLRKPRVVMMLVPAGKAVDGVIEELLPHLETGDVIIDGGNSHFSDTDRRFDTLHQNGIRFLGVGISGGEEGARNGPSMMPGGHMGAYQEVRDVFEASAAQASEEPCVAWLGERSAGHYVKMVHNGIEYGLMQLIAEAYDAMKNGLKLSELEMSDGFKEWAQAELGGFLIEITAEILAKRDDRTGEFLVDLIRDSADQLGTGMWTSQDAMSLQVPVPTIHAAVSARDTSSLYEQRQIAGHLLPAPSKTLSISDPEAFLQSVRRALYASFILTYSQGMSLLEKAREKYRYSYSLTDIAAIWRGGCIIRSKLLEPMREAFEDTAGLKSLLENPELGSAVVERESNLRRVVSALSYAGIPCPAFAASLSYFDGYRSSRLPANLIQAQRDYFGAHTYQRVDEPGVYHTEWS